MNIIKLTEDDIPGAKLKYNNIEQHSVHDLKRWLECRGLQKCGKKQELIERINHCIYAGRANDIDVSVDKGKWLEIKTTNNNISCDTTTSWGSFPSVNIPSMFNKGHIYFYIIESMGDNSTEKPFRRGEQYVKSKHIINMKDRIMEDSYFLKSNVKASFKQTVYNTSIELSLKSGNIKKGCCNCKQSALGLCSHVTALLLTLWKHVEENGYSALPCTSKLCEWNIGSKRKHPKSIAEVSYSAKKSRIDIISFDPRKTSDRKVQNINGKLNNFLQDISVDTVPSCLWQSSLKIIYDNFDCDIEHKKILMHQCMLFYENLQELVNEKNNLSYSVIDHTEGQSNNLNWFAKRSIFVTASVAKRIIGLSNETSTKNCLKYHLWNMESFSNFSTSYGQQNEKIAIKEYKKCIIFQDKNANVDSIGLCINKLHPQLGCSPDGIVTIHIKGLLEIKCPVLLKNKYIWNFDKELTKSQIQNNCLLKNNDGTLMLKETHQYYYQIQLSLGILKFSWCDFVLWSSSSLVILRIPFNKKFYDTISSKLLQFHQDILVPEYFLMKVPRDLPPIKLSKNR